MTGVDPLRSVVNDCFRATENRRSRSSMRIQWHSMSSLPKGLQRSRGICLKRRSARSCNPKDQRIAVTAKERPLIE
jgi:hypothetical protein